MPEKLSPQAVSARLTRAGFTRSITWPSRGRGASERSAGFAVEGRADGSVRVTYRVESFLGYAEANAARQVLKEHREDLGDLEANAARWRLAKCQEVLAASGLDAVLSEDTSIDPALIVKKMEKADG
jgi:hypothetical protein